MEKGAVAAQGGSRTELSGGPVQPSAILIGRKLRKHQPHSLFIILHLIFFFLVLLLLMILFCILCW